MIWRWRIFWFWGAPASGCGGMAGRAGHADGVL